MSYQAPVRVFIALTVDGAVAWGPPGGFRGVGGCLVCPSSSEGSDFRVPRQPSTRVTSLHPQDDPIRESPVIIPTL